jgi:carboxyl-terminal processing protease
MAIGIFFGFQMNEKIDVPLVTTINIGEEYPLGRVEEVLRYIDQKYVNSINTDSLTDIAIQAIINELDPHSLYLRPNEMTDVNEEMSGRFKGVGIETIMLDDTVNIVSVIPETPAEHSDIMAFDQIIKINDSNVAGKNLPFNQIRALLRGGTQDNQVDLTLRRNNELISVSVPLKKINSSSVQIALMASDSIGIVKIDQFTENTYQEFMTAVENLYDTKGMRHLIIDVRDNPGGMLSQVTKIANQLFKEKDRTIVFTKGRKSKKNTFSTNGNTFFDIKKIAVLINENSASASEILAGAIQDWDRGLVIGQPSFGKGLVQEQYNLSNGGALRLTVSKYYTPSGRSIQKDYRAYDENYQLTDSTLKKSSYKSLLLERDLYSNYGIDPDILVGPTATSKSQDIIFAYIYPFVFDNLKQNVTHSIEINTSLVDDFKSYAQSENDLISSKEMDQVDENIYMNQMQNALNKITKDIQFAYQQNMGNDDCIQAAINHFQSNLPLAQIKK